MKPLPLILLALVLRPDGWRRSRVLQVHRELREMKARCDWMLERKFWQFGRPYWYE